MEISDAVKNLNVVYVPLHANGDISHKDCEFGVISSWNHVYIFVRYFRHGKLQETAEATNPENLICRKSEVGLLKEDKND